VPSFAQGLSSGFGAYHNALLSLASRFFLREKWEDLIVPLNDAERADTERPAPSPSRLPLTDSSHLKPSRAD
jgi:hypothetical protein